LILRHDGRRVAFTVPGSWDEYHPRTLEDYHYRFGKRGWEVPPEVRNTLVCDEAARWCKAKVTTDEENGSHWEAGER
jgi:hypothetical protein